MNGVATRLGATGLPKIVNVDLEEGARRLADLRRGRQRARAEVRLTIEEVLDRLPDVYTTELYEQKCELTYQHVYDSYYGEGHGIYAAA